MSMNRQRQGNLFVPSRGEVVLPNVRREFGGIGAAVAGSTGARRQTAAFVANTAVFDGTNDYMRLSSVPTGLSDGKAFTLSFWFDANGTNTTQQVWLSGASAGTNRFLIFRPSGASAIRIIGRNSSGTTILDATTSGTVVTAGGWYHIYVAIDLATAGGTNLRKVYINGVLDSTTWTTFSNDTIDFAMSSPTYTLGANSNNSDRANGTICEFWFDDVYYDDPTKFNVDNKPISLGTNGQTPTGTAPAMYYSLNGSGDSWATDSSGNGNTMTVTGALGTGTPP